MLGRILLGLTLAGPGFAAEVPTVSIAQDGTVEARIVLPASVRADVRQVLGDASSLASLSPDVLSVETVQRGACEEVTRKTRGLLRPFKLRALRCPTALGWEESLLEQGDFTDYATEWRVLETDAGTEVVYRVRTSLDVAVPEALVRRNLVESARDQLVKLARKVLGS